MSDFPFEIINKTDYKIVDEIGATFGNDKILTLRNFRPSYVMATEDETVILSFPVLIID